MSASPGELPPPSLLYFIASVATQAKIALGEIENPVTQRAEQDLQRVRYCVDLLEVLRTKTEGNRTAEESAALDNVLEQLHARYVDAMD